MQLSNVFASSSRSAMEAPATRRPPRTRRRRARLGALAVGALALAAAGSGAEAKGIGGIREIKTSSVAYCSDPLAIVVTDLQLNLFPENRTLEFSISAASTQDDLNVSVAINLDVYGGLAEITAGINLCDIAAGFLCPLPSYKFSASGLFPVPAGLLDSIPEIAYRVPDLEAVATVQLTDTSNDQVVGCVQATLSNGHSARQSGAKWATVGLALFALFASLLHSFIAQSVGAAQWRVVDVMLAIQHPAVVSLLSLNYPIVYVMYGLNMAWSIGLVDIKPLQRSITATRARTGGHSTGTFGDALIARIGRQTTIFGSDDTSSSTNTTSSGSGIGVSGGGLLSGASGSGGGLLSGLGKRGLAKRAVTYLKPISSHAEIIGRSLARRAQYAPNTGPGGAMATASDGSALPIITGASGNTGDIGTFAERLYIAPANVFLTVLTSIGILLGIILAALLLALLLALAVRFFTRKNSATRAGHWSRRVTRPREFLGMLLPAFLSRFWLVTFPVLTLFAFYQWDFGDSWAAHLIAGLSFGLFLLIGAAFLLPMVLHSRRRGAESLYYGKDSAPELGSTVAKRWGHTAHPYRPTFFYFSFVFVLWSIIRACWIVFAQGHGFRQAVGLLVFEFVLFVLLLVFRPGRDKKSDWVYAVLTFCRMASFGVAVAFTEQAGLDPLPRVIVGFVMLVVTALPIIFTFFMVLWDLFSALLPSKRRPAPIGADEKGAAYQYGGPASAAPHDSPIVDNEASSASSVDEERPGRAL